MNKKSLDEIIKKMVQKELLKEETMKPSDFSGATIKQIAYLNSEKSWVVQTSKGIFKIDKSQSFISEQ